MYFYSVIIPVYNRPDEVDELLSSLTKQSYSNFEVIIIEDGSTNPCEEIVDKYKETLQIHYYFKENSGQGFSRNYGFEKAKGDYLIVFDSDCIIPAHYFESVEKDLATNVWDAFGGPDRADNSFTIIQKAINYSMTSVLTTGGIRGKKKRLGTYHARSFNMGISREVFELTKGYRLTRKGEDIEFSIRIINNGYSLGLIDDAFVYHKRRTNMRQFFKQLHFFGRARVNVQRFHPGELKLVHLLPLIFLIGLVTIIPLYYFNTVLGLAAMVLYGLYYSILFIDSSIKNKSILVGLLSIIAATIQLSAYGMGMISEWFSKKSA